MSRARLIFKEPDFQGFREQLLKPDRLERASFLFVGHAQRRDGRVELYVHRMLNPHDEDYAQQHGAVVEPKAEFILETFKQFAQSGVPGYVHAHSHPFSEHAQFSAIDDQYFPGTLKSLRSYLWLTQQLRDFLFVRLVYGQAEEGFTAECFDHRGNHLADVEEIRVVGARGIRTLRLGGERRPEVLPRFDRNVRFLGEEGQRRIHQTHIAICGVGGLGSFAVACAKGLGFRRITIIDPDRVEETNLNRLVGAVPKDVGKPKVAVMTRELKRYDEHIQVKPIFARIQDEPARRAIIEADVIINCLDNDAARLEAQIVAARYLKPLMDLGSGIFLDEQKRVREMGGQIVFYFPGGPCLLCQGLDPSKIVSEQIREVQRAVGYIAGTSETPPAVITLNSVIAGMGMDLLSRYLTGFAPLPTYMKFDLLQHQKLELNFQKRPGCPICGEEGVEGKGDEVAAPLPSTNSLGAATVRPTPLPTGERVQRSRPFLIVRWKRFFSRSRR
jgi:molybdopterin/thiamine biosynthesis adenylyltransferase